MYTMQVKHVDGSIVWECKYTDGNQILEDMKILSKPSLFGNSNFQIVAQFAAIN